MPVVVGLDIGGSAVRGAAVDATKGGHVLRRFAEMPLPKGAVSNGEILDEGAVAEAITALWKRSKLPNKGVVVGTANQRLVVRRVDVPQMDEEELAEALPFQVQDSIPIGVDEAVLDFIPLEDFSTPDGEPMSSILVVAIHRDVVDSLIRVTESAKLRLTAIDLQAFGLVRAAFGIAAALGNPLQAIVDIGESVTQVVIARGGVAEFVRLLPRGGEDFTAALVDGMSLDEQSAEEMKRSVGVASEGIPEGTDEDATARRHLTRQGDSLIEEIRGSINFYLAQSEAAELANLMVAGNGARLPHLANRLGAAVGAPVAPAKILDHVNVGRVQLSEDELLNAQPVLPTGVGLALWGMR